MVELVETTSIVNSGFTISTLKIGRPFVVLIEILQESGVAVPSAQAIFGPSASVSKTKEVSPHSRLSSASTTKFIFMTSFSLTPGGISQVITWKPVNPGPGLVTTISGEPILVGHSSDVGSHVALKNWISSFKVSTNSSCPLEVLAERLVTSTWYSCSPWQAFRGGVSISTTQSNNVSTTAPSITTVLLNLVGVYCTLPQASS